MAIKLLDVPGDKLFQPDPAAQSHDLLLVSHPVFLFPDVATYVQAFAAFAADDALTFFFNPFDNHMRAFLIVRGMLAEHLDLLEVRWFSMVPYRFGESRAVKYSARPCTPTSPNPAAVPTTDDNFLATRLRARLASAPACFEFSVQTQSNSRTMPVEDASVEWPEAIAPFVPLARIEIPAQHFASNARTEQCENLSFNPWRALPEHRPLGGISRARRAIYEHMSSFRHQRNQIEPSEPNALMTQDAPH